MRAFCVTYFKQGATLPPPVVGDLPSAKPLPVLTAGWVDGEETSLESLIPDAMLRENVRYAIWQLEEAPETKRLHLQMYLELKKPQRLAWARKAFRNHPIHVEERRGTRDQARDYSRKEASRVAGPWEEGEWLAGGAGARNDVRELVEMAKGGASDLQLIEADPAGYARSMKMLDRLKDHYPPPHREDVGVVVYWGEPGTGKSRQAWEKATALAALDGEHPYAMTDSKWWQGYDTQKVIIFDDFYGSIQYSILLKILDRYPMKVETKGGFKNFHGRQFVLTSNQHPKYWYKTERKDLNALKRRIDHIYHFTWNGKEPQVQEEDGEARAAEDWNASAAVHEGFVLPPA